VGLITIASIQSAYNRPDLFEHFNYIIIDECHLINTKDQGMYRGFLELIKANCVGLTATDFRLGHGWIWKGKDSLFNDLAYENTRGENYNKLVSDGYISEILSKKTLMLMNTDGIKTIAGDYSEKELAKRFDRSNITEAAVMESVHFGKKYNKWLIFAIDISHCNNITERLNAHGINAKAVHSKMTEDRDLILEDYRRGKIKALVNVNVLSTGLDIPDIDLIINLRPTKSTSFHVQSCGRGGRVVYADGFDISTIEGRLDAIKASHKTHCLVLDFAGNSKTCGALNYPNVKQKGEKKVPGEPITKTCPECDFYNYGAARTCVNCGYEFEFKENIELTASSEEIVISKKANLKAWVDVDSVSYKMQKGWRRSDPVSMRVDYRCGLMTIKEYIRLDNFGNARHHAKNWVFHRWEGGREDRPTTVKDLIAKSAQLKSPKSIHVDARGRYTTIIDSKF